MLKTLKFMWLKNAWETIDFFNLKKVTFLQIEKVTLSHKIFISKIILFFSLRNQEEIIYYFKTQKSIEIPPGACSEWLYHIN